MLRANPRQWPPIRRVEHAAIEQGREAQRIVRAANGRVREERFVGYGERQSPGRHD